MLEVVLVLDVEATVVAISFNVITVVAIALTVIAAQKKNNKNRWLMEEKKIQPCAMVNLVNCAYVYI